jgi:hypothetical protein
MVTTDWLKAKFGISDDAIRAKMAEEFQPRIEQAERDAHAAREQFAAKQEELRQAQSAMDTSAATLASLYAERDAFQG